ncbi:hypothetical protein Z517_06834 [Fonsecaea pedrosoi CBS 271.37]|uniref:Uncharacterized protein n=1 Tax=Fonsecaea pedrosoi CBS 271.37 TaxID=1442368 RepID=A0A0D2H6D2_9EURO|nr:uncharacterized protein Z517_06834 [Fonsecaea pedrosoi CBS 271.37]KIW80219.1 hypothetical protein Z517_06834 [Fonsecaea pedrosoi CBS 271.37]
MSYSVPEETRKVLVEGILKNPLISNDLPREIENLKDKVIFTGTDEPLIPINWRFAESIASLKAFEALMLSALTSRKYGHQPSKITINTNHASLFIMSSVITQILDKDGAPRPFSPFHAESGKLFPSTDIHNSVNMYRQLSSNIYKAKDGKYFHTHGDLNPDFTLKGLGLPLKGNEGEDFDTAVSRFRAAVSKFTSDELDELMNVQLRQAGTVVLSPEEYFASEHGKVNATKGLFEIKRDPGSAQPASWWPENESKPSSPKRPLAGLKVVDLTRIIAAPTMSRGLAELGASVMRVTTSTEPDLSAVHQDLNWGKWNCDLDLRKVEDKERLVALIKEADVVLDGYRPGVMERLGFSRQAVFDMVKDRAYGIIHLRENCYGWQGPWAERSGWQQISDACCGVSWQYGKAMGHDEPVTPVFPNSDYCTGVAGTTAVLQALLKRAEEGGSYGVDTALNYYSQWLVCSVGTYPEDVWSKVYSRHGSPVFRNYDNMPRLLPSMLKLLHTHDASELFKPSFFRAQKSHILDTTFVVVRPIAQYEPAVTELGFDIGTRGNGTDAPLWPKDLNVEVVST